MNSFWPSKPKASNLSADERDLLYKQVTSAAPVPGSPLLESEKSPQRTLARVLLGIALGFACLNALLAIGFTLLGTFFCDHCGDIISLGNKSADLLNAPLLKLLVPMGMIFLRIGLPFILSGAGLYFVARYFFRQQAYGATIVIAGLRPFLLVVGLFLHLATGHGLSSLTGTDTLGGIVMALVL